MIKELKGIIRKADIILAVILAVFCAFTTYAAFGAGSGGSEVIIEVDGEVYGTYPLSEDRTVDIDSSEGHNQLVIKDGKAYMNEADCPDGYCLRQHRAGGGICQSDQTIICLPNRVVVSVAGTEGSGIDAVAGAPDGGTS